MIGSGIYVAAGVAAGVLNYAFQVLASQQLADAAFADFSAWFAQVSLLLVFAALGQYAGTFYPSVGARLTRQLLLVNAAVAVLMAGFYGQRLSQPLPLGVLAVSVAVAFGWVAGQVQCRWLFWQLGLATALGAALKVGLAIGPLPGLAVIERFYVATAIGSVLPLWLLSAQLLAGSQALPRPTLTAAQPSWLAPVMLSLAAAWVPQIDLVVLRQTATACAYEDFAHASLFYKVIFFLFMIAAQWLLPRQMQQPAQGVLPGTAWRWLLLAIVSSALIGLAAPAVSSAALGWLRPPPRAMVSLSCLNMCLLSAVFMQIQALCARGRVAPAAGAVVALLAQALAQWWAGFTVLTYLAVAVVCQLLVLVALGRRTVRTQGGG